MDTKECERIGELIERSACDMKILADGVKSLPNHKLSKPLIVTFIKTIESATKSTRTFTEMLNLFKEYMKDELVRVEIQEMTESES